MASNTVFRRVDHPTICGTKRHVKRSIIKCYDKMYNVQTIKHQPSQMIWGKMSCHGTSILYFLPSNITMNGHRYVQMLKEEVEPYICKI